MVNDYLKEKSVYAANLERQFTRNEYIETINFFPQKHFDLTDFITKAIVHTKLVTAERDIKQKTDATRPWLLSCARRKRVNNLKCKEGVLL